MGQPFSMVAEPAAPPLPPPSTALPSPVPGAPIAIVAPSVALLPLAAGDDTMHLDYWCLSSIYYLRSLPNFPLAISLACSLSSMCLLFGGDPFFRYMELKVVMKMAALGAILIGARVTLQATGVLSTELLDSVSTSMASVVVAASSYLVIECAKSREELHSLFGPVSDSVHTLLVATNYLLANVSKKEMASCLVPCFFFHLGKLLMELRKKNLEHARKIPSGLLQRLRDGVASLKETLVHRVHEANGVFLSYEEQDIILQYVEEANPRHSVDLGLYFTMLGNPPTIICDAHTAYFRWIENLHKGKTVIKDFKEKLKVLGAILGVNVTSQR